MFFLFCCLDIYVFSLLDDSDSPASAIFSQEKGQQDGRREYQASSQDGFVEFLPL